METCLEQKRSSPWPFGDLDFCKVNAQLLELFQYIIWLDSSILSDSLDHPWLESKKFGNLRDLIREVEFKTMEQGSPLQICNFCGADIWNRFVQCSEAHLTDPYVVCLGCFAEGRGCKHRAVQRMEFYQMFPLENAVADYVKAARTWNRFARKVGYVAHAEASDNWEEE